MRFYAVSLDFTTIQKLFELRCLMSSTAYGDDRRARTRTSSLARDFGASFSHEFLVRLSSPLHVVLYQPNAIMLCGYIFHFVYLFWQKGCFKESDLEELKHITTKLSFTDIRRCGQWNLCTTYFQQRDGEKSQQTSVKSVHQQWWKDYQRYNAWSSVNWWRRLHLQRTTRSVVASADRSGVPDTSL